VAKKESEVGWGAASPPGLLPDVTVPSANSTFTSSKCVSLSESAYRRMYSMCTSTWWATLPYVKRVLMRRLLTTKSEGPSFW